jgi:hypothetical protein
VAAASSYRNFKSISGWRDGDMQITQRKAGTRLALHIQFNRTAALIPGKPLRDRDRPAMRRFRAIAKQVVSLTGERR